MSLKNVCNAMHMQALKRSKHFTRTGVAFRRLRGGLCLTLYYRPDDIVLKLARPKVQPSETEVKVCVLNFFGNCKLTNQAQRGYAVYLGIERSSFYGKAA